MSYVIKITTNSKLKVQSCMRNTPSEYERFIDANIMLIVSRNRCDSIINTWPCPAKEWNKEEFEHTPLCQKFRRPCFAARFIIDRLIKDELAVSVSPLLPRSLFAERESRTSSPRYASPPARFRPLSNGGCLDDRRVSTVCLLHNSYPNWVSLQLRH